MAKEQADIIRQQLEQKAPPYDDVQISSTSFQTNVIPPGIHGDRDVTTYKEEGTRVSINKVEEKPQNEEKTFENQSSVSHRIPTPEDNQNDIPPPPPGICGDRDVTTFKEEGTRVSINKVEEKPQNEEKTFENQSSVSHRIPTPEDNQNDIPPPPPGIRGDRDVTTFKEEGARVSINKVEEKLQNEEEAFENQSSVSHCIPPLEDYQNDIPPPVPACENSPRRTPPIPPPTPPPPPPPYHLSSSSQVSQSGNIPDIQ